MNPALESAIKFLAIFLVASGSLVNSLNPSAQEFNSTFAKKNEFDWTNDWDCSKTNANIYSEFIAFRTKRISRRHLDKEVKFEQIGVNGGKNFDPHNGRYTAPVNGIYRFKFIEGKLVKKFKFNLMKNDQEIKLVKLDGNDLDKTNNDFIEIVLELRKNDSVWIRLAYNENTQTTDYTSNTTAFAGQLIAQADSKILHDIKYPTIKQNLRHKREIGRNKDHGAKKKLIKLISSAPAITMLDSAGSNIRQTANFGADTPVTSSAVKVAFSVTSTRSIIGGRIIDTYTTDRLSSEVTDSLGQSEGRIQFDKVFVNIGQGFDMAASEFKAPVRGVYYFSFNVGKFPEKILSVILMKNVNEVQVLIYNDSVMSSRGMQSQSVMIELQPNETIWLRAFESEKYAVYSNLGNYITFSGYLIYQL